MPSVDAMCPACKRAVADHLQFRRWPPSEVPEGRIAVVNGRCFPAGQPAPQKCCWVQLGERMTPGEYRERFLARSISLEACPSCGGHLERWGSVPRHLAEGEPPKLEGLRLLRGRCVNPGCPVCTVTHYPCFVTPYDTVPTAEREAAVRAHEEQGLSWSRLQKVEKKGWVAATVQRWVRRLRKRAAAVTIGVLAVWQALDHAAPAELRPEPPQAEWSPLLRMFRVCDSVRDLLQGREGWTAPVPALAVPRMFRPPEPTTLPVWT